MDKFDEIMMTATAASGEFGLKQLLQVWRDYYDEIFEINLLNGSYRTMMGEGTAYWATQGFVEIEVILLAEQRIHPDDKESFSRFFDLDSIRENLNRGIYVSKLSFRIKNRNDEYIWIKVKNMIPTRQDDGIIRVFACFRRVDEEADENLKVRQEMIDALQSERKLCEQKSELIDRIASEIRSPLSGIVGMTLLAAENLNNPEETGEKLARIREEARRMSRVLTAILRSNHDEDLPEIDYEDLPANRIQYIHSAPLEADSEHEETSRAIPEDFFYESERGDEVDRVNAEDYDFSGKRVLVCEANSLNVSVFRELISRTGAEVVTVDNGKAVVIEFVSKPANTYDIVLLGIDLDELDGFSAAKCIRISGKDDASDIPLFAVTSNTMNSDIIKAYESGFSAYFAKPVDFNILFSKMREVLFGD